jgi:hypothetical protein
MARLPIPPEVLAHDADGREGTRLLRGHHRIELLRAEDAVPLHVAEAARLPLARARVGDARQLDRVEATARAVEAEPPVAGLSAHHLAIATRP